MRYLFFTALHFFLGLVAGLLPYKYTLSVSLLFAVYEAADTARELAVFDSLSFSCRVDEVRAEEFSRRVKAELRRDFGSYVAGLLLSALLRLVLLGALM